MGCLVQNSTSNMTSAFNWNFHRRSNTVQPHTPQYYLHCFVGGVLSSSIRWIKTPLDSVKCLMQVQPEKYTSFQNGLRILIQEEGYSGLSKGLGATVLSYGCQSGTKYFLYEVLKDRYSNMVGPENTDKYRSLVYVAAAGSAEAVADVFMTPWEMIKVKQQTSKNFPKRFLPALLKMAQHPQKYSFPFGSLVPLWARQVPGTITNFFTFESTVSLIYTHILTEPKESYPKTTQLGVTFVAGYVAGFCATIISHPADTLVSLQAKKEFANLSLSEIARQVGWKELATKGLGPRILMTGTIIGYQWLAYDTFKTVMGMGTTGNKH